MKVQIELTVGEVAEILTAHLRSKGYVVEGNYTINNVTAVIPAKNQRLFSFETKGK